MTAIKSMTQENPSRLRQALDVVRRFHLGAPDGPAGEVPAGAVPVAFEPRLAPGEVDAPAVLARLRDAVAEAQGPARRDFARRARELAAQAEALLETERLKGGQGRDPERLGGALGAAAGRFLDPSALAGVLGKPRLAAALGERRARCLAEAAALLRETAEEIEAPRPTLVHDGTLAWVTALAGATEEQGWTLLESADPCAGASDLFDQQAWRTSRVLLAARRVKLEAAGEYDPARHDLLLDAEPALLDWPAFTPEELALLPPVVALESAHQLAARGMVGLSKLLLSGRPVQVLLMEDPTGAPGAESPAAALAGFRFQPAYLGLAQREAYVQQGSLARMEELSAGFRRAAGLARAGLHVVEAPGSPVPPEAAVAGRAHPLFQYDPEAGTSWADRMDFAGNPAPEEDWPEGFTFADACLFAPALAGQFLPVPEGVPEEALATVPEWLALDPDAALERVPYVLARVPAAGPTPVRLAVSRPLALACRDRLGYWRTLQELAGVRSEYVRRAEARAREAADARLAEERERLEARHAKELERVRRRAVEDVVNRLTAAVLGVDGALFASPLASLAGGGVEEVTEDLLGMVAGMDPDRAEDEAPGDEAVERMISELTGLLGTIDPHEAELIRSERP